MCSRELYACSPAADAQCIHAPHWGLLVIPVAGVGWDVFHTNLTYKPVKALMRLL